MAYSIDYEKMTVKELKKRWRSLDKDFWRNMGYIDETRRRNDNIQNRINHIRDELDRREKQKKGR